MSEKKARKLRQEARKRFWVKTLRKPFKARFKIAWKIIKGKIDG